MAAKFNLKTIIPIVIISIMINHSDASTLTDLANMLADWDPVLKKYVQIIFQNLSYFTTAANDERHINISEVIKSKGYATEDHTVISSSGYLLYVIRISSNGPPVLLAHGLASSSFAFADSDVDSLMFKLADNGYDVWSMNCRGNMYSNKHTNLSTADPEFWKFSFHEIGIGDVRATIDYILDKTNRTSLAYIGHSQGGSAVLALLAENPPYNKKISVAILLAPIAFLSCMKNPIVRMIAKLMIAAKALFDTMKINQFLPSNPLTKFLVKDIYCSSPLIAVVADCFLYLIWGTSLSQIDLVKIKNKISQFPAGTSMQSLYHYLQILESGKFRKYDFGDENMKVYGSRMPPNYDVKKITTKMCIIRSKDDYLASEADIDELAAQLRNVAEVYTVPDTFNHQDFSLGQQASSLVYPKVMQVIKAEHVNTHTRYNVTTGP